MKKIIVCLLFLQLIGCATTTQSSTNAAGSSSNSSTNNSDSFFADQSLSVSITQILNTTFPAANINVEVDKSLVLLTGEAGNQDTKNRAGVIVMKQPGVSSVYNYIEITHNISADQVANDIMITSKVKTKMLLEKGLPSTDIKVVTTNGVVYLMGRVSPYIGSQAASVASTVPDVKKVITVFQYNQ